MNINNMENNIKIKDLSENDFNELYDTLVSLNNNEPLYNPTKDRYYTKEQVRNDYELIITFYNRIIIYENENSWFKIVDKLPSKYHTTMLYGIKTKNKEFIVFKTIWRTALITNNEYWKWNNEIIINELK